MALWTKPNGPVEGANGAELGQQAHGRARFAIAAAGTPVANTRQGAGINTAYFDMVSPQVFTQHPRIKFMPAGDEPVNEFTPHLPGRVPPAGWDGESGAHAPNAGLT